MEIPMNSKEFVIEIRSVNDFFSEIRNDIHKIESGLKQADTEERVYFESVEAANRYLTPKRVELLHVLHAEGQMNTHELAKRLERDYKNVRQDVLTLSEIGLIVKRGRLITAPWGKISMELNMAA
jgi:predicted transcriptional regulator